MRSRLDYWSFEGISVRSLSQQTSKLRESNYFRPVKAECVFLFIFCLLFFSLYSIKGKRKDNYLFKQ